jgi:phenylacetate-coenzyme A ligase PaaK-like adenylate-forming protein
MDYERQRQRHLARLASILPEQVERLGWPAERIRRHRERGLRDLLCMAIARSHWHRRRLGGIDLDDFGERDLERIPPMTKDDLMANWDAIVTDPRLTLEATERHLAGLTSDAYLLDEYHAAASGGSSGRRGVYVYGFDAWAVAQAGFIRPMLWDRAADPEMAALPPDLAVVASHNPAHMTSSLVETFANPSLHGVRFPIALPIAEVVAGLNQFQPVMLLGYPTALAMLAVEADQGRLRISPKRVVSSSEPLLPQIRRAVERSLPAPLANMWGTSEAGPMAVGCWRGPGMHLCDDLVIVEPVDRDGRPVPPGVVSDKVLVTAISNPLLPLIRLEITDQVQLLDQPCPCGSAHRLIADIEGRLDDLFAYPGGVVVHPHVFRAVLAREVGVVDYQVRQTPTGAEVLAVGVPSDRDLVGRALAGELSRHGLASPSVQVRVVDGIERQSTGKMRRFVPMAG